jgi:membrane peptidoglycan carboxypeptidase
VAGKTGTTENYGDAWFVGSIPQLTVAVWVGYPRELRPMEHEYHGDAVAGGTFPAEIWHTFVQEAVKLKLLENNEPQSFPSASIPYAAPRNVVLRDGLLQVDNGNCHSPKAVLFFSGQEPRKEATCRPNEVDVPDLVGQPVHVARSRLAGQPLTASIVYKVARPGQKVNVVLEQSPRKGRRSAYDRVTLVLAKPTHGVVPRLVGMPLERAQEKAERRGFKVEVEETDQGIPGKVLFQLPRPGVAAAPGMVVRIAVAA